MTDTSKRNVNNRKTGRRLGNIICIAQFVISVVLLTILVRAAVLPQRELIMIGSIILLLQCITLAGMILGRKRHALRIASGLIGVCISAILILLSAYMWKSDAFIRDMGSATQEERHTVSVAVRSNTIYTRIEDLQGCKYAYVSNPENKNIAECVDEIKSYQGPLRTEHAESMDELVDMLYEGGCDAIIIEDTQRGNIVETHEDFETMTRTIWSFDISRVVTHKGNKIDVTREPFNIYLCGSDSRSGVDSAGMNDVNMIVTVNPLTNQILITSIPRDFYVPLASYNGSDKLSNIGAYGLEESIKTIEQFTGLEMDFYVKVGFDALVYMVDAIGGIDVESDAEFTAWTNPDVHIQKGMNHMDGVTALAYARERYAYEDGDLHRAQNQAQVMREIAWKAMSPALIVHYGDMLDALAKGMRTSMTDKQIKSLIRMQMDKKAQWDIRDFQMTGTGTMSKKCLTMPKKELFVMIPDMESVQKALDMIGEFTNGEI